MSAEPKILNFVPGPYRKAAESSRWSLHPGPGLPGFQFQVFHDIACCCVMLDEVVYLTRSVSSLMKSRYLRDY